MIDKEFVESQKKIIENSIKRIGSEVKKNGTYLDLGSTSEDNSQEFEVFEENQAFAKQGKNDLKDLEAALGRIEKGEYGLCLKCGQPIERGRLKAYPEAAYCVTHAKNR